MGGEIRGNIPIADSSHPANKLSPNLGPWVAMIGEKNGMYEIGLFLDSPSKLTMQSIDEAILGILIPEEAKKFQDAILVRGRYLKQSQS